MHLFMYSIVEYACFLNTQTMYDMYIIFRNIYLIYSKNFIFARTVVHVIPFKTLSDN